MAFCDYEHCDQCVTEAEQRNEARRRGEALPDDLPDLVGYKAIYVGDNEVREGVHVICSRHLEAIRADLARVTAERDAALAEVARRGAEVEAMRAVCESALSGALSSLEALVSMEDDDMDEAECWEDDRQALADVREALDALRARKVGG